MIKTSSARGAWLNTTALSLAASAALALTATEAQAQAYLNIGNMQVDPNVLINNNFTNVQARDPVNINGIGQIVTDAGGGSVGTCTGTLINRRTVIFAAHCVNTRAATAYGAGSGGTGIAVAFETNTRANAAGETDELVRWLLGGAGGAGRFQTNTAQALYNINQVYWDPRSTASTSCTQPGSCFLEADIAMGALDTPANNVPSWTMLFSPLPAPGTINPANGTGYHVTISGYGNTGNGTTGIIGADWRRRTAENMLGALTSINVKNQFLFGTTGNNPQALYFLDFDDPARANARDFNLFRDNALTREGITGPGDSGGPLILDRTFAQPTIIGVLSGGTTYFNGQPRGSYGTDSFYQPLFLYWDWIVANNPYRYATASAGDGAWEDASRWVTELDPAYQIISGGNLVNGIPTNVGAGRTPVPGFGELCFQLGGTNECQNIATGQIRNNVPNTATDDETAAARLDIDGQAIAALPGQEGVAVVDGDVILSTPGGESVHAVAENGGPDGAEVTPHAPVPGYSDTVRPAATLANGLPGATNFVPNNTDGVRATGVPARYYDITLRNAGTTTLSSTVTIDRFGVAGANSGLNIATAGSLTSLVDVIQTAGRVNVDGNLRTSGDYALIGGLLSGRGTVTTPFLTSVLGTIAPGTVGTIGTLTVAGNVVMSSGSQFAVDVGATTADQLRTTANGSSTGLVNLGGIVNVNLVANPTFGQRYTIISAAGGVTGQFAGAADMPGVLRPSLSYTANTVVLSVAADSYLNFVDRASGSQTSVGLLLDRSRSSYASLSGVYGVTDLLEGQALGAALESLAPYAAQSSSTLTSVQTETVTGLISQRLGMDRSDGQVQGLSVIGGVQVAALNADLAPIAAAAMARASAQDAERARWQGGWKQGMAGFLTAGYANGEAASLAGTTPIGLSEDDQKTWYVAGGLERTDSEGATFGAAVSYSDGDAEFGGALSRNDTKQINLIGYAQSPLGQTGYVGGYVGLGQLDIETERNVTLGATAFRAEGETEGDVLMSGFELGDRVSAGNGLTIIPHFGMDVYDLSIDAYRETGSAIAMDIGEVELTSAQAFIGLRIEGQAGSETFPIRPALTLRGVADSRDGDNGFSAAFAGTGVGPVRFIGASRDQRWGEISGSVAMGNETLSVILEASSMVERDDIDYQSYRATVSMKF